MMLRRLPLPFGRYPATVGMPFAGCRLFDSHTLGEVSGLIHVFAEIVGHFIAEQLHGRERQKRAERAPRGGNRPQVLHMQIRPRIGQRDDRPSAGLHFHDIRFDLWKQRIIEGKGKSREFRLDQGDGPVLHLPGGIALRVDVGNFLELQSPFQREGEGMSAPQIEKAARGRIQRG